ncbi:MAG: phosphoribosylformylglycinamidine cyclo-ligase [Acetobacteraceae bacterium]
MREFESPSKPAEAARSEIAARGREVYRDAGVRTAEADTGTQRIIARFQSAWPSQGLGRVLLRNSYFANVIEIDGLGIAVCTDGVGSKSIIADQMRKYDTIGIDCVAMNVNDMICVGARPVSLVDYIAVEHMDAAMIDAIGAGLHEGAKIANITVSGGEIAQLKDIVCGFDLVGTAVGRVELDKVISGRDIRGGDSVIGVKSNGIHSNGMSLARKAFFKGPRSYRIDHRFADLSVSLGEELLRPTDIYVPEALEIIERVSGLKALINITSDGLLNLTRAEAQVGFVIDDLIEPQPIFSLIQQHADVDDAEMFEVFNMGIGFCYVVSPADAELAIAILKNHHREAQRIGYAVPDPERHVRIPARNLIGRHKRFRQGQHGAEK